jgi:hypothetical protein
LIGYWEFTGQKPDVFLAISAASPTSLTIAAFEPSDCAQARHYSAVRTRIEERDFLDLWEIDETHAPGALGPISYEFPEEARLVFFLPDNNAFVRAVEAKELAGTITKPFQSEHPPVIPVEASAQVRASTAELRRWIAAHPAAMHGKPLDFIRRDPASAPHCG